jgi:N6-L-threonylcarbamoyladenine synthase
MKLHEPLILAIESSCDDTSAAVMQGDLPLSNIVSSQAVHEAFGGVIPEMASREHMRNIRLVCSRAMEEAGCSPEQLEAIAFTLGPGLPGSLIVGASFAKGLATALKIPMITVNHLEAHILSLLIGKEKPDFPFLGLIVSGGHTQLLLVEAWNKMEILGSTRDDAVGEAFDKCAKILGLGYPGGRVIDQLAKNGNPGRFRFPVAKMPEYQFSYSGVKTSFLYFTAEKDEEWIKENLQDLCASIQDALLEPIVNACRKALDEFQIKNLGMAGGVAANSALREKLQSLCLEKDSRFFYPPIEYCTDNAAMIGRAACFKFQEGIFAESSVQTRSRLPVGNS